MADKPPASSLLQRLRQQSDAVRANESPRRSVEEILLDMDQRLWRAYRWLDEALAHLGVIKPVVAHDFRVESYLTLSGLQFEQGFVSYRRRHLAGQPQGLVAAADAVGSHLSLARAGLHRMPHWPVFRLGPFAGDCPDRPVHDFRSGKRGAEGL